MADTWKIVSTVIGWAYFIAWSVSFYPQAIENYFRKNVAGFSLEFALLNPAGFYFYTFYSTIGIIDPRFGTGKVEINDLVFAVHAVALSTVQLMQVFIFPRGNVNSKFTLWPILLIGVEIVAVVTLFIIQICGVSLPVQANAVAFAGYSKMAITLFKYMPQVYLNYKRKSTVGWSLENVILDLTGGTLSLVQLVIDVFPRNIQNAFNPIKFSLSVIAIFFDLVFLFQHYVLYREAWQKDRRLRKLKDISGKIGEEKALLDLSK